MHDGFKCFAKDLLPDQHNHGLVLPIHTATLDSPYRGILNTIDRNTISFEKLENCSSS